MDSIKNIDSEYLISLLPSLGLAIVVAFLTMLLLGVLRRVLCNYLNHVSSQKRPTFLSLFHEALKNTRWLFIVVFSLLFGCLFINVDGAFRTAISRAMIIVVILQVGIWSSMVLRVATLFYQEQQKEKDPGSITTINIIRFIGRLLIWVVVLLLVLDNIGINITALVAGLGVGGIAVALAVQTILGDLFASLSIALDKPFVVGDFLIIGELLGTVEYVGLKTTRLRSLSGEQLVFSNSDLLNSRIRNYGRMFERRVVFSIGVTYQTPRDKLKKIPEIIKQTIEAQENTRFDRSHFKEYGTYSMNFESVYYVLGADYNQYMDIQQSINLGIHEQFEQLQIEFAYPTQTLLVANSAQG